MIRLTELKLSLAQVPTEARRAADAPAETERDRLPPPHPDGALRTLAAGVLGITPQAIAQLQVFKRSFDARKADLLAVYIVDIALASGVDEAALLEDRDRGHRDEVLRREEGSGRIGEVQQVLHLRPSR